MTRNWNNSTTSSQAGGPSNHRGLSESKMHPSDGVGYNKDNDTPKEGDMPTDLHMGADTKVHADDPIMTRTSHMHGKICVFPPASDPSTWADSSWLLTTEKDANDSSLRGLTVEIKAKYVKAVYTRPHFIHEYHRFGTPDTNYVAPEKETWTIDYERKPVDTSKKIF